MRKISIIIATALLFIASSSASAQDKGCAPEDWRDRIKAEKIAFITDAVGLTSAEAEKFWPVYNKFEAEKDEAFGKIHKAYKSMC